MIKHIKNLFKDKKAKPQNLPKILFLLKNRTTNYGIGYQSSGLFNSARLVAEMLIDNGYDVNLRHVVDSNGIDREVHHFKPDIAIIEAFWVTPSKFEELQRLHPNVRWIVRNHSKPAFLSQEGSAFGWIKEYLKLDIEIASNSFEGVEGLWTAGESWGFSKSELNLNITYLPNYYTLPKCDRLPVKKGYQNVLTQYDNMLKVELGEEYFNIGCFGAVRVLKNNVNQALAAIKFANTVGTTLKFHINAGRIEHGDSVLKSLRAIFSDSRHVLVEHPWYNHGDFLNIIKDMDIVSQVSHSESFCIVAADAVAMNIPVICSKEIEWLNGFIKADCDSIESIAEAYLDVYDSSNFNYRCQLKNQRKSLAKYNKASIAAWLDEMGGL